jgi:hypothetical protein
MGDEKDISNNGNKDRLEPLHKYILKLYAVGGIPLVFVGIGALILTLGVGDHPFAAGLLLSTFGLIAWVASIYVATIRWKYEIQIIKNQDNQVLRTVCEIALKGNSDVVKKKIDALSKSLSELGIRRQRN